MIIPNSVSHPTFFIVMSPHLMCSSIFLQTFRIVSPSSIGILFANLHLSQGEQFLFHEALVHLDSYAAQFLRVDARDVGFVEQFRV